MATWTMNTGCKYHTQDDPNYCGPAVAMMVLAEIGVPYSTLNQANLFTTIKAYRSKGLVNGTWFSDPIGLQTTLVSRRPGTFTNTFIVSKEATEQACSRKIVYALRHYHVSAIAIVGLIRHWIVVCGVTTNVDPIGNAYTIKGFWVNTPVDNSSSPHAAADVCGSNNHGIASQWVTYRHWQTDYSIGADFDSVTHSLQYISICDPDVPDIAMPTEVAYRPYFDRAQLLREQVVIDTLKTELTNYELYSDARTSQFGAGVFGKPVLVHRLDDNQRYYYLTPTLKAGAVIGFGQTDALQGNLESVFTFKDGATFFELDLPIVVSKVTNLSLDLPGGVGVFQLLAGQFTVDPVLVWKQCRQSTSSHLPFWRITSGPHTFYRRIDGRMYSELTVDVFGV